MDLKFSFHFSAQVCVIFIIYGTHAPGYCTKCQCVGTCVQAFVFHLSQFKLSTHINLVKKVIHSVYNIETGGFFVGIMLTRNHTFMVLCCIVMQWSLHIHSINALSPFTAAFTAVQMLQLSLTCDPPPVVP